MKIDIEQLNRKMPYPEPSDEFFKTLQDNVIARTVGEKAVEKKDAKVFALNFKWVAAASVVLLAGITAFFGLSDNPEMQMAQQKPIVDSVYEVDKPAKSLANQSEGNVVKSRTPAHQTESLKTHLSNAHLSKTKSKVVDIYNNTDRQDYAVESRRKPEAEVEKVLAAFTPDQLKDLEKNSEQDVYLDLYN